MCSRGLEELTSLWSEKLLGRCEEAVKDPVRREDANRLQVPFVVIKRWHTRGGGR